MEDRLQKILARAGIASRRAAEKMIIEGRVSVNGLVVRELGTKADPLKDNIRIDDRLISCEATLLYIILHKPRGFVTTMKDPQGRPIVADLLSNVSERVFPVGRLDYDTEGLLILTNDGDFAYRLQHPKFGMRKTYRVKIEGRLTDREIRAFESGMTLSDGPFKPQHFLLEKVNRKSCWLLLTITEGRNRMIRRAFESMGHSVVRLIRVAVGAVELGGLKEGAFRYLSAKEVLSLRSTVSTGAKGQEPQKKSKGKNAGNRAGHSGDFRKGDAF